MGAVKVVLAGGSGGWRLGGNKILIGGIRC